MVLSVYFNILRTHLPWNLLQLGISGGGMLNAQALKQIKAGGDGAGLRVYDPGCVPAACFPQITFHKRLSCNWCTSIQCDRTAARVRPRVRASCVFIDSTKAELHLVRVS